MTERIPKSVLIGGAILAPTVSGACSLTRNRDISPSQTYLGGLIFLEFLFAALWMYRQVFFPLVLLAFLFAGTGLAVGGGWTVARWVVLGVGGLVGCVIMLKERGYRFRSIPHRRTVCRLLRPLRRRRFHDYPRLAVLKALSVLLLFVYCRDRRKTGGGRTRRPFFFRIADRLRRFRRWQWPPAI